MSPVLPCHPFPHSAACALFDSLLGLLIRRRSNMLADTQTHKVHGIGYLGSGIILVFE